MDPLILATSAARGKRKLRPLPRGAEDAVLGYWRFEKGAEEDAAEKVREKELRRIGKWGPRAKPVDTASGLWGVGQLTSVVGGGGGGPGALSPLAPWAFPLPDLSKTRSDGLLFDAALLLALLEGGGNDASLASLTSTTLRLSGGPSALASLLSAAVSSTPSDAPFDAGDPTKVREARVYVGGLAALALPPQQQPGQLQGGHLARQSSAGSGGGRGRGGVVVPPLPSPSPLPLSLLLQFGGGGPALPPSSTNGGEKGATVESSAGSSVTVVGALGGSATSTSLARYISVGGPGFPSSLPFSPSWLHALSSLCAWGVAVPVPRFGYTDCGE